MGKKRKSKPMRPWCWYCEKDFEDDKVLVTHQRAKHFKCGICNKKLTTAGGMVVHCQQVHKISIYCVPNALPGRNSLEVEIFGMEGIPEEDMIAHEAKLASHNNNTNKKSKGGSGQYGELTLEQIQQQMEARKTIDQQQQSYYGYYPSYYNNNGQSSTEIQNYEFGYTASSSSNSSYPGGQSWYYNNTTPLPPPPPQPHTVITSPEPPIHTSPKEKSASPLPIIHHGSNKKKATKTLLIYNHLDLSPEEQRAKLEKYSI